MHVLQTYIHKTEYFFCFCFWIFMFFALFISLIHLHHQLYVQNPLVKILIDSNLWYDAQGCFSIQQHESQVEYQIKPQIP